MSPDNYQEEPANGLPIELHQQIWQWVLTSTFSLFDLGYLGILELISRIHKILTSMEDLRDIRGHFYNWYDTRTKKPLNPKYISTVDSGNLVGYLWLITTSLT